MALPVLLRVELADNVSEMPEGRMRSEVLDHGYVELIESWGSDERIIEAARMSTNKGFQGWPQDEKLLRYLWENKHHTPFEMAGMTIEVQAPIFVFREWQRHRTQSYNELSARYTEMPNLYYVPDPNRMREQGTTNKQGSGKQLSPETALLCRDMIERSYTDAREIYEVMLHMGLAREVARVVLPVGQYSRMRASANLRNWLAFLTLRTADNAQWEIREFASKVENLVVDQFPRTWLLFNESNKRKE